MRVARAILDTLRAAIGDEPLLGVTVTASMPGYVEAVAHLRCDIDYFGIGNGDYDSLDLLMPTLDYEPGFGVPFARAVKEAVPDAVVIAEGRITRPEVGERALADGSCDLVGMTRAQIADPELVRKAAAGEDDETARRRPERLRRAAGCGSSQSPAFRTWMRDSSYGPPHARRKRSTWWSSAAASRGSRRHA